MIGADQIAIVETPRAVTFVFRKADHSALINTKPSDSAWMVTCPDCAAGTGLMDDGTVCAACLGLGHVNVILAKFAEVIAERAGA